MSYQENRIFTLNEPNAPRINPALAVEIGLNESMLLLQIEFWISISNNERDGRRWTYQSTRDIQEKAFPFWSHHTINRAIKSLESKGYITTTTEYNKLKYDKTRWISLNFDTLSTLKSISVKGYATGSTQNETGSDQNATTIPENTTDIKNYDVLPVVRQEPETETPPSKEPSSSPSLSTKDLTAIVMTLFALLPDPFQKPSIKNIIESAVKRHGEAYVRESIVFAVDTTKATTWQEFKAYLDKTILGGWSSGYLESKDGTGSSPENRRQRFLESRRSMPNSVLVLDAENGCAVSQQVCRERGIEFRLK